MSVKKDAFLKALDSTRTEMLEMVDYYLEHFNFSSKEEVIETIEREIKAIKEKFYPKE